jgi:hypothetical protein
MISSLNGSDKLSKIPVILLESAAIHSRQTGLYTLQRRTFQQMIPFNLNRSDHSCEFFCKNKMKFFGCSRNRAILTAKPNYSYNSIQRSNQLSISQSITMLIITIHPLIFKSCTSLRHPERSITEHRHQTLNARIRIMHTFLPAAPPRALHDAPPAPPNRHWIRHPKRPPLYGPPTILWCLGCGGAEPVTDMTDRS